MRLLNQLKKMLILMVAALSITLVSLTNSGAADAPQAPPTIGSGDYLYYIMQYTYGTMKELQNTPTYLRRMAELIESWLSKDDDDNSITTKTQGTFAQLGVAFNQSLNTQNSAAVQQNVLADLFGIDVNEFKGRDPSILKKMPDVNNLAYSTLIGIPPAAGGKSNPYQYVQNSALLNMTLPIPEKFWQGKKSAIDSYKQYFTALASIQSFNAYIISQLGADGAQNPNATKLSEQLIQQVSGSGWIAQIASEDLGKVLRQILLFESQNYVLNSQIQQAARQQVAAQAMTNSLLILFNKKYEEVMIKDAKGLKPY
tara:strand:- start:1802 stop:2740 length:939 start_codon:yes stop_codon:yes gene_type:complete